MIRAVGPTLGRLDITDFLPNPAFTLKHQVGKEFVDIGGDDNWSTGPQMNEIAATAASIGAFDLDPDSLDAAMVVNLAPGLYSAITDGQDGDGVALVELYDADPDSRDARLANISTRAYVRSGSQVMIAGFAIVGSGPHPVLIRAVGPGLQPLNVSDVMSDPTLTVYAGDEVIGENRDWSGNEDGATLLADDAAGVGAFPLAHGSADAALTVVLAPGVYTVHVASQNGGEGTALVEVYSLAHEWGAARVQMEALPAGATLSSYRVDGGPWNSIVGDVLPLRTGAHVLEFATETTGIAITPQNVEVVARSTTVATPDHVLPHRLRFHLHESLVGNLATAELHRRIAQYAAHVQQIFHRETRRRFIFDPATDILIVGRSPFSDNFIGEPLPQLGFEVWVYAEKTDRPDIGTYGGWGTLDLSGAGGATGLYWDQIHDPLTIEDDSEELTQYWRQIDHIVHELEHTFGAGYGEYYSANPIARDLTGIEPILPPLPAPNDFTTWPFWDEHEAYWADPLTANADGNGRLGPLDTLESLLAAVQFGPATRGVINGLHRGVGISSLPDLSNVRVRVVDAETGEPIPHATVRVWERPVPVWTTTDQIEETVSPSTEPGVHLFTWTPYPHPAVQNNSSNMKLIKAWAAGYQPAAKWEWIYAAQEAKTLRGEDVFTIILELQPD